MVLKYSICRWFQITAACSICWARLIFLEVQLSGANTLCLATGPDDQDSVGGVCAGTGGTGTGNWVPFGD